jgi:GNAT superfamily N-acetyltransferase
MKDWPDYTEALKRRGPLTVWFDPDMSWQGFGQALMARLVANLAVRHLKPEAKPCHQSLIRLPSLMALNGHI